ncbi:hypothetical protein ACGFYU_10575 [Streptomyces sp. NPDC048337]|uniref:hypothetical protein n=1 Tax=Streptomyces sp. NPDC048337 TaxID=3365535 RepID=UPI0037230B48
MYEMRAESTADRCELIWHVVAKAPMAGTLCGGLIAPDAFATGPAVTAATERYCDPCMTAFGTVLRTSAEPSGHKDPA